MPSIEYSGERIEYCIERKKIKHVNLRITAEGAVKVSAPRRVSHAFIQAFVEEKADWIWRRLKQREQALCNLKAQPEAKDGAPLWLLWESIYVCVDHAGQRSFHRDGYLHFGRER